MPEHCAKMYEKRMRSKIPKLRPVHEDAIYPMVYDFTPTVEYTYSRSRRNSESSLKSKSRFKRRSSRRSQYKDMEDEEYLSPAYETMLDYLRADIKRKPSQPILGLMPNLGIVTIYNQPVSSISEQVIKEVSKAYSRAVAKAYKKAAETNSETPKIYRNNGTYSNGTDYTKHYEINLYPGIEGLPGSPQDDSIKNEMKKKLDLVNKIRRNLKTRKNNKNRKIFKHGDLVAIFKNN